MNVGQPTLIQNIIQWANIIIQGFIYPLGILVILGLAYMKFSRWVDSQSNKES